MCNRRLVCSSESFLQLEYLVIVLYLQLGHHQPIYWMDGPPAVPDSDPGSDSAPGSNDGMPRVKFLCSFGGSILPRPQDGKLRYVGGETRIVCFPREITYDELMGKMRELYECVVVLKYQQPDEDLDALVSVVNDDDVMNMMEEYDKLECSEGLSRLRIFLFSQLDQDFPAHYIDGDDRDSERRYVDALNNMNDPSDFWRLQQNESAMMRGADDFHLAEQFFNPMTYDGSLHNQRNGDMPLLPYGLRQVTIPRLGSGQFPQHGSQRYSEIDGPWSPGYYSPRNHGFLDPRSDYPSSPASGRQGIPFGEASDKGPDRAPDENARSRLNHQLLHDQQGQTHDNVLWLQGDKSGFPGNSPHSPSICDGNSGCEHSQTPMPRNHSPVELTNMGNNLQGLNNPCIDCRITLDNHTLNANTKVHPFVYQKEQMDPHGCNDGWILQHQLSPQIEDPRANLPGTGRLPDHYLMDGSSSNFAFGRNHVHHRHGPDVGSEIVHEHPLSAHGHIPYTDDRYSRYRNMAYAYGPENSYPVSHVQTPAQSVWRNIQNPVHGSPPYDASCSPKPMNGAVSPGLFGHTPEGSPRFRGPVDNQNGHGEHSNNDFVLGGNSTPGCSCTSGLMVDPNIHNLDNRQPLEIIHSSHPPLPYGPICANGTLGGGARENDKITIGHVGETGLLSCPEKVEPKTSWMEGNSSLPNPAETACDITLNSPDSHPPKKNMEIFIDLTDAVPGLIDGVKRVTLEGGVEEANAGARNEKFSDQNKVTEGATDGPDMGEAELDSDNESSMKIEPTKAEEEAIARGLQSIKNEDLEEIRVLGSGTYGAVYHGKWRGSDVAIKRIKASCFAGKPSERERLISDFWREALILSSLHHPNVVSFYGIVRDGPDGSLATVTEFMVNGSLKQFLQKKDRTIDRRKRLILAMDTAFGMEYLHGKNIVHFDLKCENLLVNMRDPQRPVCKIGDLGLSKVKQHTLVSGGVRGTLPWMAPELLSGKSNMVTEKIDVYSFGIVMWELLTGDEPYADMHCASIIGGIVNNSLRPQIPSWCDPEWRSLMESCWASDPAERPSFSEISQKLRGMAAAINVK